MCCVCVACPSARQCIEIKAMSGKGGGLNIAILSGARQYYKLWTAQAENGLNIITNSWSINLLPWKNKSENTIGVTKVCVATQFSRMIVLYLSRPGASRLQNYLATFKCTFPLLTEYHAKYCKWPLNKKLKRSYYTFQYYNWLIQHDLDHHGRIRRPNDKSM